jgi:hypothetical protein
MNIYFIWSKHGETTSRMESIVDETQLRTDHVYSHHHDDGFEDDAGHGDKGIDVEELMRNVAHDVLI